MQEVCIHVHPLSEKTIHGRELNPEEFIKPGDHYPNLRGEWVDCADDGFGQNYKAKDFAVFGGPVIRPVIREEVACP